MEELEELGAEEGLVLGLWGQRGGGGGGGGWVTGGEEALSDFERPAVDLGHDGALEELHHGVFVQAVGGFGEEIADDPASLLDVVQGAFDGGLDGDDSRFHWREVGGWVGGWVGRGGRE